MDDALDGDAVRAAGPHGAAEDETAEERVFAEALSLPPQERASHVLRATRGDRALASRVLDLLAAHATAGSFLEGPAARAPKRDDAVAELKEGPGTEIGPYELIEELGEGGFGVVYRARQHEPVRRDVALKIIKLGMDTRQVIARFEAERQALAVLEHPNIARVLDAGATPTGRPYFVMELVEGIDITRHCDAERLDVHGRVQLFLGVCDAIQHAHQRGLIHRDLKPSNLLVSRRDGRHSPKVIDFGIAKATKQRLTEQTLLTEVGQIIGTPVYMSPEQAERGDADVDTRSDVYSLGVVLYELLAGAPPFEAKDLRGRSLAEIQSFIREYEAPPPSVRIQRAGAAAREIATARGSTSPTDLGAAVRGDLDWIVMKALEKERERRYDSVAALAQDLERYLVNLPVLAGPPSAVYKARKFVRRHRIAVGAGAVVVAALVSGVALMLLGFVEARANLRTVEKQANFVVPLLFASSVDQETRNSLDFPALEADFRDAYGPKHPGIVWVLRNQAERLERDGLFGESIVGYRKALAECERFYGVASREHVTLLAALGRLMTRAGLNDDARPLLVSALAAEESAFGTRSRLLNGARTALSEVLAQAGDGEGALGLLATNFELLGAAEPVDQTARLQAAQAFLLRGSALGRTVELGPYWLALLDCVDAVHGATSTLRADVRLQLAGWNRSTDVFQRSDVVRWLREALDVYGADAEAPAMSRAGARSLLAELLLASEDKAELEEGLLLAAGAIDDIRTTHPRSKVLADALESHAAVLEERGRFAAAIRAVREVIDVRREVQGAEVVVRKQKEALERLAHSLALDASLEQMHPDFFEGIQAMKFLMSEQEDTQYTRYRDLRDTLSMRYGNPMPLLERVGWLNPRAPHEPRDLYTLAAAALAAQFVGSSGPATQYLAEAEELAREPHYASDQRAQEMVAYVRRVMGKLNPAER